MTLSFPSQLLRTLWQRDQDPHLDPLRLGLHRRLLLLTTLAGVGYALLRGWAEHRLSLLFLIPLEAGVAWLWLRGHPQHHRRLVRLSTLFFLGVGFADLLRPGQSAPWALFGLAVVPVFGTLVDGLVSGGLATVTLLSLWAWQGTHADNVDLRLMIIFTGLSSICFYFTSLAYTWFFGALLQRQGRSQSAIEQASTASQGLALTLSNMVSLAVDRLRGAQAKGLPDRRTLKDLNDLLVSTREALPRNLSDAPILPQRLLREQRRGAHKVYLFMAFGVSLATSAACVVLHIANAWIAIAMTAACGTLLWQGDRLPVSWPWRLRLFLLLCLAALSVDVTLARRDFPAASLAFLPLIVFYAGMLDGLGSASLVFLVGLGLLGVDHALTSGHIPAFFGTLMEIHALSSLAMLGIVWVVAPSLREQLDGLSTKEEELRASLHRYRQVVSTLFHDLANPLAVLQTLASLPPSLLQPEDQERARRMVERLETVTRTARRKVPAQGNGIALVALDRDLHDLFQERLAVRGLSLAVTGPPDLMVRGEARLRDSLIVHLLSNAVRFAPEGGLIALEAAAHGGGVRLILRDGGPGYPEDVLADLARGAAPRPRPGARADLGNGFGLLLALSTARDLGGRLSLRNAASGGAVAELWLPV